MSETKNDMTNPVQRLGMRTLQELIDHLEAAVERAEEPGWCVLSLTAEEADDLLHDLRNREKYAREYENTMDAMNIQCF